MKRLPLAKQGRLVYALSPFEKPRLRITSGETVVLQTEDAFSGQVRKEGDRRDTITMPLGNPQTGPIYVEGAEAGDALAVHIIKLRPTIGQGASRFPSWWWYIGTGRDASAISEFLEAKVPHGTRICKIKGRQIHFNDQITIPYEPMIGTIGTAPAIEAISSELPGPHGGNMDLPDVKPGNTLYLPVNVPGALLYAGDVHAAQGDGEICGTGIEMPSELTLRIDLVKHLNISWPRIKSREYVVDPVNSGYGFDHRCRCN